MAIDGIGKLLSFGNLTATKGVSPKVGGTELPAAGQTTAKTQAPTSKQAYVGVNSNIGVGDSSYIAAQVGKKEGVGKTLAFA